jgi:hypothetical protein
MTDAFGKAIDPIITHIVNPVVMLAFAIGLLVFAFGVFELVWKSTDEEARTRGRTHMLYGTIGMLIMVSAWGIIRIVSNTVAGF